MVERGRNVLDIIGAVQSKFSNRSVTNVPTYLERWLGHTGRQLDITPRANISDRQRADLVRYGVSSGYERRTLWVDWVNPNDPTAIETKSFYVDIPHGLAGKAKREAAYNRLIQRLSELYEGSIKTQADLARFIFAVREGEE